MLIEPNGVEVQAYTGHLSTFSLTLVSPLQPWRGPSRSAEPCYLQPVAVEPRHRLLAAAGEDGVVRIWSLDHALPLSGAAAASTAAAAGAGMVPGTGTYEAGAPLRSLRGVTALVWLGALPRLAVAVGPRLLYFD